jgi:hypothetical protein
MPQSENTKAVRIEEQVRLFRRKKPAADRWAAGYGSIQHTIETQARIFELAHTLEARGVRGDSVPLFDVLYALDWVTSAAMWLVVHEIYSRNVYLDGRDLALEGKAAPELVLV